MDAPRMRVALLFLLPWLSTFALSDASHAQKHASYIPKTWDDAALASLEVPLAEARVTPKHVPADYYYRMPVAPIYRSYPVYHPSKEPARYLERLRQREPEIIWDDARRRPTLRTEAEWIRAGELVFDAPRQRNSYPVASLRDPAFYIQTRTPVARDGTVPFLRYVVRKKGEVEVEAFSCATCHTRVMADGSVLKGAQGNFSVAAADAFDLRRQLKEADEAQKKELQQFIDRFRRALNAAPWVRPDPLEELSRLSLEEYLALTDSAASVTGVMPRTGSSLFYPVQIPDLIGVKDRRYLDRTGLVRHRDIDDLMRYSALAQGMDMLASYGDFRPIEALAGKLPDPVSGERYSDEQLYALHGTFIRSSLRQIRIIRRHGSESGAENETRHGLLQSAFTQGRVVSRAVRAQRIGHDA